jgi:RNA polymerase sigma factor (TIGR02999 family)
MAPHSPSEVTDLLVAWSSGEQAALDRLIPLVYEELRRLAHSRLRHERAEHTLQTTALVHEAYCRLVDQHRVGWQSRGQFFAIAAQTMRRILVDYARRRKGQKRGGAIPKVAIDEAVVAAGGPTSDVLAVDGALTALAAVDLRKATMVELRFFGGLSIDETAEALQVSPGTVMRDWTLAKAWLQREIRGAPPAAGG